MSPPRLRIRPPLPPSAWLRRPLAVAPFPLAEPSCTWHAHGAQALVQGVRRLALGAGDEWLVPACRAGTDLARAGLRCRVYEGFEPDEDELQALLSPSVRGLVLTHHLGFPQDAQRWRGWCDRHGLLLLEDAAQAWLAERAGYPVGAFGDLAVFCLYLTLGVPDGALLLARGTRPEPTVARGWAVGAVAHRHAEWIASRGMPGHELLPNARAAFTSDEASSRLTPLLVARLGDTAVAAERRARYGYLLGELGDEVVQPFSRLDAGASPFAFPIRIGKDQRLRDRLAREGIEALDVRPSSTGASAALGLPVHQELRPTDLERIVAAVRGPRRGRPELSIEPIEDLPVLPHRMDGAGRGDRRPVRELGVVGHLEPLASGWALAPRAGLQARRWSARRDPAALRVGPPSAGRAALSRQWSGGPAGPDLPARGSNRRWARPAAGARRSAALRPPARRAPAGRSRLEHSARRRQTAARGQPGAAHRRA